MAPTVLVIAAFSMAALRAHLLPRWVGWAGVAIAVSGAVGTIGIVSAWRPLYPFWFGGIFGWVLWILAVGVVLGLRARRRRG
jgi:hypothetical protein